MTARDLAISTSWAVIDVYDRPYREPSAISAPIPQNHQRYQVSRETHLERHRHAPEDGDNNGEHGGNHREGTVDSPIPRGRRALVAVLRFLNSERECHAHEEP